MNPLLLFFYAIGALSLVGAIGVVASRNVVYSALFLLMALLGVAGLYILLFAEFLALVQVLIYGGAVAIIVLFGLMLTRFRDTPVVLDNPQRPLAAIASIAAFFVLGVVVTATKWAPKVKELQPVKFGDFGNKLFSQWVVPFEIASLVLLVALIGAIIIARSEDRE